MEEYTGLAEKTSVSSAGNIEVEEDQFEDADESSLSSGVVGCFPVLLTHLNLAHCQIDQVPASFFSLLHLEYANLSFNALVQLDHPEPQFLFSLVVLNVSNNLLVQVPNWAYRLTKIKQFNFSFNPLSASGFKSIDGTYWKRHLGPLQLDMSSCKLSTLPAEILQADCVTALVLGNQDVQGVANPESNSMPCFPKDFCRLSYLTMLIAPNLCLSELPDGIGDLQNLRHLDVRNNEQYSLPNSLTNLAKLEHLNASQNLLESLPPRIEKMPALKELILERNRLTWLPEDFQHPSSNLILIDLYLNKLDMDEAGILARTDLHYIDLEGNCFDTSRLETRFDWHQYTKQREALRKYRNVSATRKNFQQFVPQERIVRNYYCGLESSSVEDLECQSDLQSDFGSSPIDKDTDSNWDSISNGDAESHVENESEVSSCNSECFKDTTSTTFDPGSGLSNPACSTASTEKRQTISRRKSRHGIPGKYSGLGQQFVDAD